MLTLPNAKPVSSVVRYLADGIRPAFDSNLFCWFRTLVGKATLPLLDFFCRVFQLNCCLSFLRPSCLVKDGFVFSMNGYGACFTNSRKAMSFRDFVLSFLRPFEFERS
ncbi:hypothetical protein V6N13_139639 [Hibiscus sabdariffa]